MKRGLFITLFIVLAGAAVWIYRQLTRPATLPPKPRTVEQVLAAISPAVKWRLKPAFAMAGVAYPPKQITLLAFKEEKRIDLYAMDGKGQFRLITSYPILAASGHAGPKLQEGDQQVPEGFYRIELLNPNSSFHLSLRVNYPNADDLARAQEEGRDTINLGSDIMIHGKDVSTGCLAMGDAAVEELFVLAQDTGLDGINLIIAPCDLRTGAKPELPENAPVWTGALHERLREALKSFR